MWTACYNYLRVINDSILVFPSSKMQIFLILPRKFADIVRCVNGVQLSSECVRDSAKQLGTNMSKHLHQSAKESDEMIWQWHYLVGIK